MDNNLIVAYVTKMEKGRDKHVGDYNHINIIFLVNACELNNTEVVNIITMLWV